MVPFPRAGPLSGMVLTAVAVAAAVVLALVGDDAGPPSPALVDAFGGTVALMVLHKVESFAAREWEACPVYLTLAHDAAGRPLGRTLFLALIPALLLGFVLLALVLRGGPWPVALLGAWLGQGLHEWHHLAKSVVRRRYYPGVATGVAFAGAVAGWFAPLWFAQVGWGSPAAYAGAAGVAFAGFVVEDRGWWARWGAYAGARRAA